MCGRYVVTNAVSKTKGMVKAAINVKDNENFLKITLFLPTKKYKFRKSRSDFDFKYFLAEADLMFRFLKIFQ